MSAVTMEAFSTTHRKPMIVSVVGHVLLVAALSSSFVFMPQQPLQQLAIEAVIVDDGQRRRDARAVEQQTRDDAARERERERERQRQAEAQRQQELVAQRQREEQARAEQQRKQAESAAAAEKQAAEKRAAEQRAADQRAAEQRAAEQRAAEQRAAEQRAADERREAAERARVEAEKREQARRQAELAAALAAEEELLAARSSSEMAQYITLIAQKVEREWRQPASAVAGVECQVVVKQLPSGDVVDARVTQCNGDETVRRSIESAVLAASPLPLPQNRMLFDRNLRFTFRPQVGR